MDAMQKFLEYASAYDDGSEYQDQLKNYSHAKGDGGEWNSLQRRAYFAETRQKSWRICVRYITISEDLSS